MEAHSLLRCNTKKLNGKDPAIAFEQNVSNQLEAELEERNSIDEVWHRLETTATKAVSVWSGVCGRRVLQ